MPPAITLFQVDSLKLWKTICSSKLLENATFILFMNKSDILEKKLKAGVRLAKYVRSFQDRPNDSDTVQKCMLSFYYLYKVNALPDVCPWHWNVPSIIRYCLFYYESHY